MYSSASLAIIGDESLALLLRAAVTVELILHNESYCNHSYLKVKEDDWKKSNRHINSLFHLVLQYNNATETNKKDSRNIYVLEEAVQNLENRRWCSMIEIFALASVLKRKIQSVYPKTEDIYQKIFNGAICPVREDVNPPICIMWTRTAAISSHIGSVKFHSNHFVPLVDKKNINPAPKRKSSEASIDEVPKKKIKAIQGIFIIICHNLPQKLICT